MPTLRFLPCLDSEDLAASRRRELQMSRERATSLGLTALEAVREGYYRTEAGDNVAIRERVQAAVAARVSLPPEAALPPRHSSPFPETVVSVVNETTLGAARGLVERGLDFLGVFSTIVFAITDWSPERRFLAPFRDAFAPPSES